MIGEQELRERAERYIRLEESSSFRKEVQGLLEAENWQELNDRFYRELRQDYFKETSYP